MSERRQAVRKSTCPLHKEKKVAHGSGGCHQWGLDQQRHPLSEDTAASSRLCPKASAEGATVEAQEAELLSLSSTFLHLESSGSLIPYIGWQQDSNEEALTRPTTT